MKFTILSEDATLEACATQSIARFGDGELRLAAGGGCSSQQADPKLATELCEILATYRGCLVGVPNFDKTPNRKTWDKYAMPKFTSLMKQPGYGSAFITRPDNAPWIDRPDYWDKVRDLWRGKDVILVAGDDKSLSPAMLSEAASVRCVCGPHKNAWDEVDLLEEEITAMGGGPILLCLGACATVLAARLDRKGRHALDLGHIGMFMRHAGAYAVQPHELASKGYRQQLQRKHRAGKWGVDGHRHAREIADLATTFGARSVLDYGCGAGTLKIELARIEPELRVLEYDPGIPGKDPLPKPADLVICTDVLEHVEPEQLKRVLQHLHNLTGKLAYYVISLRVARERLPDGRNAHLIVQSAAWWITQLRKDPWTAFDFLEVDDTLHATLKKTS